MCIRDRFTVQTARDRIMRMSMSGLSERTSVKNQPIAIATASTQSPITFGEVHPHTDDSLTATSSATSQLESKGAASQLIVPSVLDVDSSMKTYDATVARLTMMSGSQKSQWYPRMATIGPANTMPRPAPTAINAAIEPITPMTRSRGNSSRMMPKVSGKAAPATPWMTLAMIITITEVARAARSDPRTSAQSDATKIRFLPYMSPTRPRIGVQIEAESR